MKFAEQLKIKFIKQLVRGVSRILIKLLEHFNCTAISRSFILPVARDLLVVLSLNLNDSESLCYHLDHLCDTAIILLMF